MRARALSLHVGVNCGGERRGKHKERRTCVVFIAIFRWSDNCCDGGRANIIRKMVGTRYGTCVKRYKRRKPKISCAGVHDKAKIMRGNASQHKASASANVKSPNKYILRLLLHQANDIRDPRRLSPHLVAKCRYQFSNLASQYDIS